MYLIAWNTQTAQKVIKIATDEIKIPIPGVAFLAKTFDARDTCCMAYMPRRKIMITPDSFINALLVRPLRQQSADEACRSR
jgi:hypothetical protein